MSVKQKAVCPNNPAHTQFRVFLEITEEWMVDEYGILQKRISDSVTDIKDVRECIECGTQAIFVKAQD